MRARTEHHRRRDEQEREGSGPPSIFVRRKGAENPKFPPPPPPPRPSVDPFHQDGERRIAGKKADAAQSGGRGTRRAGTGDAPINSFAVNALSLTPSLRCKKGESVTGRRPTRYRHPDSSTTYSVHSGFPCLHSQNASIWKVKCAFNSRANSIIKYVFNLPCRAARDDEALSIMRILIQAPFYYRRQ